MGFSVRQWCYVLPFSRLKLWLAGVLLLLGQSPAAYADVGQDRIDRIKAAFVFNIAKFVTWPQALEAGRQDFVMCLYRTNTLGDALNTILGKHIGGKPLKVFYVDSLFQRGDCQLLLIPPSQLSLFVEEKQQQKQLGSVMTILDNTEADTDILPTHAVMITLVRKGSGIEIHINRHQTRQSGLQLRADLLKLAKIVD